ncbi:MAG: CdaR family protein [Chloroflexi bacterium]|nr:CdaR family protein [Chloroflexota bacterium]
MLTYWRQNLPWIIFSLLLSFALWTVITRQQYPEETNAVSGVPVEVTGLPADLVLRNPPSSVRLWVSAPRQRWPRLGPDNFRAQIDASRAQAGVQELPVHVTSLDPSARVLVIEPNRTSIGLERIALKDVGVQVKIVDSVSFGFEAGLPSVAPQQARVSGPESAVDQIVSVVASLRLDSARSNVSEWVRPVAQTADGRELRDVSVSPETVLVEVPIKQEVTYRTVPVVPQIVGEPALGYQMVGIAVDPSSLTVVGDPTAINDLRFLSTKPVDLGRTAKDLTVAIDPQLPANVALARDQKVTVRVSVSPTPGTMSMRLVPIITGADAGLEGSVEPNSAQVMLSGPTPVLGLLTPQDVQVIVNATDLGAGSHKVTATVVAPPTVKVEQVVPPVLTVTLRPAATATPANR